MKTTGTATGHNDLLVQLHDWLVATVGWTEMAFTAPSSPPLDTNQVSSVLRAPGASAGNEYFLYMDSRADVGNSFYGIKLRAALDYDDTLDISAQLQVSPEVYLNLWNDPIDYWFYATGRRVIAVAKVNTSYVSMYAGLFLPFALPSEYPKPFYLGASFVSLNKYDVNETRNRFIADPGDATAFYLNRNQSDWITIQNHSTGTTDVNFTFIPSAVVWPHRSIQIASAVDVPGGLGGWNYSGLLRMRPAIGGDMPLYLCHIVSPLEYVVPGALDGVYSIPGFGKTSEQILSFGSPPREFRAFQNVFRTTERDFLAIEEA
jgi:hypothetical protein